MRDMSAKAVLLGWLMGSRVYRGLIVSGMAIWALAMFVGWTVRRWRYTLPLLVGLVASLKYGLVTGAALCIISYSLILGVWAYRLLGKSRIDTWPELIHGLPRLWRLYRTWPTLVDNATVYNIRVTPTGVEAHGKSKRNSARLKKEELDLAAGLRADRVVITPTSSWTFDILVDWGTQYRGNDSDGKHILYGLVNEDRDIIYVGRTAIHRGTEPTLISAFTEDQLARRAAENRKAEHIKEQPWASEISDTEVLGVYPSLEAVEVAEEDLIRRLGPTIYNKEHNYV